jgi:hypothetical protein
LYDDRARADVDQRAGRDRAGVVKHLHERALCKPQHVANVVGGVVGERDVSGRQAGRVDAAQGHPRNYQTARSPRQELIARARRQSYDAPRSVR